MFLPGQDHLRWSRFKNTDPAEMHKLVANEVFPFLRDLGKQYGGDGSTYSEHMRDARFHHPDPRAAGESRRHAGRHPDGGPRHQR